MTRGGTLPACLMVVAGATACARADAQALSWQGYLDLRVAAAPAQAGWNEGGLGKVRFGGGGMTAAVSGAVAGTWQLAPEWQASATLQLQTDQQRPLDLLDASLRYRPVSTSRWRWSAKVGAFFPPVSLENDAVGWTSPWTLAPSAINSWVGEELRSVGMELRIERRGATAAWSAFGSAFGANDPAGELLAARGWALGDLTSGLRGRVREPDAYAAQARTRVPVRFRPVLEIDHRVGWYAGAAREGASGTKLVMLRYDNRGDPEASTRVDGRRLFAWRTRFWSLAGQARWRDVDLLAQAMDGSTAFEPVPGLYLDSRFSAGYLLAAWDTGTAWQPVARIDAFRIRQLPDGRPTALSEHGHAATVALNWRPDPRWRLTAEWLRVASVRSQRRLEGLPPRQVDVQLQVSVRRFF